MPRVTVRNYSSDTVGVGYINYVGEITVMGFATFEVDDHNELDIWTTRPHEIVYTFKAGEHSIAIYEPRPKGEDDGQASAEAGSG